MENMSIVIVGHVDHGKSTVIGRMLVDTNSLPEGKLEQVKETCRRNSKPFEYAFLLDALRDEQDQGITIDAARIFFRSVLRNYIILDAPGHIEFLKNMVTGASRAEAALLVIDANEGIQENSRRHGYLLSMLGIKQVSVVVNKMDLVDYSEVVYQQIVNEYKAFLSKIDITASSFIPVSGFNGDNVVNRSENLSWYQGCTILEQLDLFKNAKSAEDKEFRMPVQSVYKFTRSGDDRRIIAGTISTGTVSVGDEIIFYPSGKRTKIKSIESFNTKLITTKRAGLDCGFTMTDQIYISRGEIASKADEKKPEVSTKIKTNIFWLGKNPLVLNKRYLFKIGTAKVGMYVEEITRVLNASNLSNEEKGQVDRHEVAECIISLEKTVAYDLAETNAYTSRFVIIDAYEISGGGIITESIFDEKAHMRDQVIKRNRKWEPSRISWEERARRYNQKASVIMINGPKQSGKKELAKELERQLFSEGKIVYYMGMSNILYGVDADIKIENSLENKSEQIRRMAEVLNLMLDAGMLVIISTRDLDESDKEILELAIGSDNFFVFDIDESSRRNKDVLLPYANQQENIAFIRNYIENRGIIFKI